MNDLERRILEAAANMQMIGEAAAGGKTGSLIEYFGYNVRITQPAVAVGAQAQGIIPVLADSDFVCCYVSAIRIVGNGVAPATNFLMQITDTGTGQDLFNEPGPMSFITGGMDQPSGSSTVISGAPFVLPFPRIIAKNTNVAVNIINNDNAPLLVDVFVCLNGMKVYGA